MDLVKVKSKIIKLFNKYKYAILVLTVGLVLLLWPSENRSKEETVEESEIIQATVTSTSDELTDILKNIQGAGNVKIMLSISQGEQTVYQTNDNVSVSDSSSTTKVDTVTVVNSDKDELGLVKQVNPPEYLGAIIVCQGADDPSVRLAIVDAVSKITGLGADKISVLKMK